MKARKIIGKLLLGFVLISIGFAIGKEVGRRQTPSGSEADITGVAPGQNIVIVYYMHTTFRCVTCNLVESMGKELVDTEYAEALKADRLEWRAVNYQDNEQLAARYKVGGNMIVVVKFENGQEVASKRLIRVMELANKRDEYMLYVRQGVDEILGGSR
jgi:hypothetical protein